MTNDTTTLNGALTELGELMADNLVTMGVSDADASDGLTTLANKILDVPVTPVTQTLTLSSDKSILSYADSETATLTATLSGGTVSGQTIEFFNGNTSMGTATTDSNGVATKSYASAGVGDVSFTAEVGSLVSETYIIEDCFQYASQVSIASFNNWENPDGITFGTSSPYITLSGNNNKLLIFPYTLPNDIEIEYTVKHQGTDSCKCDILDYDKNYSNKLFEVFFWNNYIGASSKTTGYWANYNGFLFI